MRDRWGVRIKVVSWILCVEWVRGVKNLLILGVLRVIDFVCVCVCDCLVVLAIVRYVPRLLRVVVINNASDDYHLSKRGESSRRVLMCSRVLRCDADIYGMASMYIQGTV